MKTSPIFCLVVKAKKKHAANQTERGAFVLGVHGKVLGSGVAFERGGEGSPMPDKASSSWFQRVLQQICHSTQQSLSDKLLERL